MSIFRLAAASASKSYAAWDLSYASYSGTSFDVSSQELQPLGIFLKDDGSKMYIAGGVGEDITEYSLSSDWDISTATYSQNFSVFPATPTDVFFKPDGIKMYVVNFSGDTVREYDLSVAWDISSASYLQFFSLGNTSAPGGIFFKPDGTKMYIADSNFNSVREYNLSSAWDVSSASHNQNFSVASQDGFITDVFFKPDGTKMYVVGLLTDAVYEYNLSTPWDVSSSTYLQNFSVASQLSTPEGLFFKPDGTKMYVVGADTDTVYQYDLG